MKLVTYLNEYNISVKDFAKMAEICLSAVYKYLHGTRPQQIIMMRIIKVTKGKVTHEDMGYEVTYKTTRSRRRGNDRKA